MKRLLLLALIATPVLAADDQLALTQAALQVCRQQTADANAQEQARIAPLVVEIERLRKELQELRAAAKAAK